MLMASTASLLKTLIPFSHQKPSTPSLSRNTHLHFKSNNSFPAQTLDNNHYHNHNHNLPNRLSYCSYSSSSLHALNARKGSSDSSLFEFDDDDKCLSLIDEPSVKFLCLVLLWASLSLSFFAFSRDAKAAVDSIKASGLGVRVATALRTSGWPDEAIVFSLATLPLLELRGAIPVGYWLKLNPTMLTILSIIGNMVPVPFIVLYFKRLATFLAGKNETLTRLLDMLFKRAKEKAGPVEEFQWLGLMLFVAVPFPGTGAWTGAFIASVLDMPFWPAISANFFGVVFAGLLVNLLVNLGLKYAVVTGIILFIISTFMWSILRSLRRCFSG